jgi:hypothetical protein
MDNQIVNVDLGSSAAEGVMLAKELNIRLTDAIPNLGQKLSDIDLGIELNDNWPVNGNFELSKLIVLAYRLKLKIIIKDIELQPL